MGEFVEGFETMSRIGPCVSIFGSARTKPENKYYQIAEEVAYFTNTTKIWSNHRRWTWDYGSWK